MIGIANKSNSRNEMKINIRLLLPVWFNIIINNVPICSENY